MASITSLLPSQAAAHATQTSAQTGANQTKTSQTSATGTNALASQSTFLQLLVAQLKNQDPTQPVQGTEFVTQLAQFSDLEQNLAVRQDLDGISSKFLGSVPSTPAGG